MPHLLTPRVSARSTERVKILVSNADYRQIGRGRIWTATVTDINTGERFNLRHAGCGIPHCHCDAVIVRG